MSADDTIEESLRAALREFAITAYSRLSADDEANVVLELTSRLPLSHLDFWERLVRHEFPSYRKNYGLRWLGSWSPPHSLTVWLNLVNSDGRKREDALKNLSGNAPNAFFFSLALCRLNDWVPEVRAAARENLPRIVSQTNPSTVANALRTVLLHWDSWGRLKPVDGQAVLEMIRTEEVSSSLRAEIISSPTGPMPRLFTQLGRTSVLDRHLLNIAANAVQPAVRAKAYRCLFERRFTWTVGRKKEWVNIRECIDKFVPVVAERKVDVDARVEDLLRRSAKDSSSFVRRVSAEFLIRDLDRLRDRAVPLAKLFARESSTAVRERGEFALRKLVENRVG